MTEQQTCIKLVEKAINTGNMNTIRGEEIDKDLISKQMLKHAVINDYYDIVEYFIKKLDVEYTDDLQLLSIADDNNNLEMLNFLLENHCYGLEDGYLSCDLEYYMNNYECDIQYYRDKVEDIRRER